ncbi:MAG: cell division protein FtsA [Candidatus Azobacteroides pseudotrichonymphae]|jgi:cell division protein FtsA|nr:MAG: cell division protein FtsA [Candidatus Azobacteroides pseudotrichonymphae]
MHEKLNNTGHSHYVVALDLGTSKLLAMAARKTHEGISILDSKQIPSGTCIRRGCVYKIDDTANIVRKIVNGLSHSLNSGIKKVYVGIGGQSLRAEYYSVKKEINGLVTNDILLHLEDECRKHMSELIEVLEIVFSEYFLDGKLETNPKNMYCKEIETKYQLILGRPSLKNLLKKSIEGKAGIEIAGFFISPLATAEAVLTSKDKRRGCALIEFGAGITYLSIYREERLKYLVTIPLGGNVITKDLCCLGIVESEAETLKINDGNALIDYSKKEQLVDTIIEARVNEIVTNIVEQIKQSGCLPMLDEGIIITGGASLLKNLDKLLSQQIGKQVRRANIKNHAHACILGLLALSKDNCAKETCEESSLLQEGKQQKLISPPKRKESLFGKLSRTIFDD